MMCVFRDNCTGTVELTPDVYIIFAFFPLFPPFFSLREIPCIYHLYID